ncbi:beige protein-like 1 [Entomophthora muscae]|uniref:Beige protein-like 1 n=1 Tax=Entomophthora muscae TaxID=34485 RepID=A0ACC2TYJ3_9FUNG|nr:beige protein-like 1 [Entomophthora muscae]
MVMKLLTQSVQKFLHFPMKELSLIPFCIKDAYNDCTTLKLLYTTLASIVGHSALIKTIAKEIGIFFSLLYFLKECFNEIQGRSKSCPRSSLDGIQEAFPKPTERLLLLPQLLSAIAAFIKDDPELACDMCNELPSDYFAFLVFDDTRGPFLKFLDGQMGLLCKQSFLEQDDRTLSAPHLLSQFLQFLNSQRACLSLTMDCLDFLKVFLKDNQANQLAFAKEEGFLYVLAVMSDLKGLVSSSSQRYFLVLQKALLVLVSCICGNPYAQWVLVHKVGVSTLLEYLDATEIFETIALQPVAFGFLFGLVLGDSSLLDATFSDEVARLPEQLLFGTVRCPDLIPAIFHFSPKLRENPILEKAVLNGLWSIINGSMLNQISFSQQDVAVNLLRWNDAILSRNGDNTHMLQTMTAMLHCLLELSANDIDILKLLRGSYDFVSLDSLEILQVGLERGVGPPMFHFDCDADHPPSIVLPGVTRSQSFIGVHTTMLWVQVVRLPEEGFLPLLRFTSNGVVSYEVLLSTSRTLTIQCPDSLSITFDGSPLQEEIWNHIAIVHSKAMLSIAGGSVTFYLNGSLAESRKVAYSTDSVRPEGTLLLGDTAPLSSAVWNMGPVSILDEALDSSVIESVYQLGPIYCGNFQDGHLISNSCADVLKQPFQILPRDSKTHDSGCLVTRDKLVVSLRPRDLVFRNDTSQKLGAPNQRHFRLEFAIESEDGIAWLSQGMAVALSPHLSLDLWKVGGCGLMLKLVADAYDAASLKRALSILALAMRNNPCFGAEMVRIKGYDILGFLLKNKAEFAEPALIPLLRGLSMEVYEGQLCIQNATAFQCLVLDFEVWKGATVAVQGAVIGLLKDLVANNPHNLEILNDLGAVKRLLFALRYDHLQRALLPSCVEALRWLLVSNYTQENIRLVVSFITSTLSRDGKISSPMSSTYRFDRANIISDARTVALGAHHLAVGNAILEMLHDLLQEDSNCAKLASMITSKWLLLLYGAETNPYAIILATRILARLFLLGPSFISKFRSSYLGFAVLIRALPKWWFLLQLYHAVISMLLGVNVDTLAIGASFDFFSLVSLVSHGINANKELAIDATVILFHMIKSCLSACLLFSSDSLLRPREVSMTVEDLSLARGIDEGHQNAVHISRVVQTLLQFFTELYHTSKGFRAVCCRPPVTNIIAETLAMFSEGYNDFSASQFDVPTLCSPKTLESGHFSSRTPLGVPNPSQGAGPKPVYRRSLTMPEKGTSSTNEATSTKNEAVEAYMEFVLTVCCNDIIAPAIKPLSEVEGILKAPFLGSFEGYTQFTNYFLSHVVKNLKSTLVMSPSFISDTKALVGIAKFSQLCVDSCYQGFFTAGLLEMFDLLAVLIQSLVSPTQVADARSEPQLTALLKQLNRMILYCLTETSSSPESRFSTQFLKALLFQHNTIFSTRNSDISFWRSFCHHLFVLLQFDSRQMRIVTFNIWKLMLLMKGQDLQLILKSKDPNSQVLLDDFRHMLETDLEAFYAWFELIHPKLSLVFAEVAGSCWEDTFKAEKGAVQDALACSRSTLTSRAIKQHQTREAESKAYQKAVSSTSSWAKNLQVYDLLIYPLIL